MSDIQKFGEDFQRVGKDGFDAAVSSFGEVNKGLQAIAAEAVGDGGVPYTRFMLHKIPTAVCHTAWMGARFDKLIAMS